MIVTEPRGIHPVIHHVALPEDWEHALEVGEYAISTRGRSLAEVGFIHCAHPDQVAGVVERFYADVTGTLLLLSIDPADLDVPVVEEPATPGAGEHFPHVYGPIPLEAVHGIHEIHPQRSRGFR